MAKITEDALWKMSQDDLRGHINGLVMSYNEAMMEGNNEDAFALDESIKYAIGVYTANARNACFDVLKKTADPMLEAVKQLTFPTIKTEDKAPEGSKIPVRSIKDTEKPIDLLKLHNAVGGDGIGKRPDWSAVVEKFNFLLTARLAEDIGLDPRTVHDSYAMSKVAHTIEIGEKPTSNTNILKTLQKVIDAMIGPEYKATSHDVRFILASSSKHGRKALSLQCSKHKQMRGFMAEVCHKIVLGKQYGLDYQTIK